MIALVRPLDAAEVKSALQDLAGIASLLIDASHSRDPSQRGVEAAARFIEEIHSRLVMAVGFQDGLPMSMPLARRGFLRGLTTLPLIGGGVTLIGQPSAAAVPVTSGLLATYSAWLHYERMALNCSALWPEPSKFVPGDNPGFKFHDDSPTGWVREGVEAQRRAAIVLAAVGCPLTSPEAEAAWSLTFRPSTREARS
ncbi:hypothetical protein MKL09_25165 [Methylobacterium sp. J-048]|uniref:hypothetical protein n=1 Tax=Methylobacterium sp. J-048 TaxID=2836635 RepID=UPI001FBA10EB|nr:hypothetical protein [Methylobacterium sp. J-048]MCJ2059807.1 hypothetical protein [Methylobacterium sp. J-048]